MRVHKVAEECKNDRGTLEDDSDNINKLDYQEIDIFK